MIKKISLISLLFVTSNIIANEVKIVDVKASCNNNNVNRVCNFNVTLKHEDKGWDHFANKWQIYTPEDKLITTRTLHHPHVNEQPFTRGLSSVKIPKGLKKVHIKAHDSVHGYSNDVFVYVFNKKD